MRIRTPLALLTMGAILIAGPACGRRRDTGYSAGATAAGQGEVAGLVTAADQLWETDRNDAEGMQRIIAAYQAVIEADASNYHALVMLARAHYFWADGYIDDDTTKGEVFNQATFYGEQAMGTHDEFRAMMEEGSQVHHAVAVLPDDYIESIYWTASSLGKWAVMQGFATVVGQKDRIRGMIERVTEIDSAWYHSAALRYWGTFYAKAPPIAGGDMTKSQENYEAAIAAHPDIFATRVLYAQYYAVKAGERELFEQHLSFVLEGDPNNLPDLVPEQRVEQAKARALMDQIDDLF